MVCRPLTQRKPGPSSKYPFDTVFLTRYLEIEDQADRTLGVASHELHTMMETLPSYQEATARRHWLELAAPYVDFNDYRSLCLVDRQSWGLFAPRLWGDLLNNLRRTGLDPGDDVQWWITFVFDKLGNIREVTRALVRTLDTTNFARESYNFQSYQKDRTLQQSFRKLLNLCRNVTSVVLDHHEDIDAGILVATKQPTQKGDSSRLRLLSMVGSNATVLTNTFFSDPAFEYLTYLDLSWMVGSVRPLLQQNQLYNLRMLKIRGREIDNNTLAELLHNFRLRLWSLDISNNNINDDIIDILRSKSIAITNLRSDAYFPVEGRLIRTSSGTQEYGVFYKIAETIASRDFKHAERYFVDAPTYVDPELGPQLHRALRNDGRHPVRKDSVGDAARVFSGLDSHFVAEDLAESKGLTHLCLSATQISAVGVAKLLRESNGHLENLDIALNPLLPSDEPATRQWPKSAKLYGVLGMAHLIRPVFSSNLRVLRVHHSLVTQIPTLTLEGMSTLARDHISETRILTRVEAGFAEPFRPDMNPRLTSLTLTCIPRRSSGPLVDRLVKFLKALSCQERTIQDWYSRYSDRRSPGILKGLRHLRLEFEPDAREEGFSTAEDLDAEDLMTTGETGFSFFEDEKPQRAVSGVKMQHSGSTTGTPSELDDPALASAVLSSGGDEYLTYRGTWNGQGFSVPVWLGPRGYAHNIIISDYRHLVLRHNLKSGVGPVTPAQVLAGAPEDCHIFHTAWYAATMPTELESPPTTTLSAMKDVLEELQKYRSLGRREYAMAQQRTSGSVHRAAQPRKSDFFWTGELEVVTQGTIPQARPTQYWR